MRELLSESFSFALKAVCSGAIKAIFFKALRAVITGTITLEAAAVAVCAGALETAAVARVTRSCLGLLQPLGVFMVLNL